MKHREFFTLNKRREKAQNQEKLELRHEQDSSKGFGAKKCLNSLQASLMMFSPKYFSNNQQNDQFIEPWNGYKIKSDKKCKEKMFYTNEQTQREKGKDKHGSLLKSIKSQVIKNKRKLTNSIQHNIDLKRQKLKTQQPYIEKRVRLESKSKQKRSPKAFFLKKIDLLVKIKQKIKTNEKYFKKSSKDKEIKLQKLPRLQKITIDLQPQSKNIAFSSHSALYNQLSELSKLISSQSVTIKPKAIF